MKRSIPWLAALMVAGVVSVVLMAPAAKSQIQATPSYLPIGVSAAGTSSMAWFHEPSSRSVIACQSAATGTAPAIQCTTTKLP